MAARIKIPRAKVSGPAPESAQPAARSKKPGTNGSTDNAVDTFLRELKHPLKPVIEAIRQIILNVSAEIREDVKWNAPSFYTTEHFATFNLARAKDQVMLILHTGAKPRKLKLKGLVGDPTDLLKWLADDRCLVTFESLPDVEAKRQGLRSIIRKWIQHV